MKKSLFILSLALLSMPVLPQGRKYTKAMQVAVEQMRLTADPVLELEVAASFEAIAANYPDQWLPAYHASRICITSSFEETDAEKKEALLDRARSWLEKVEELVPEESEMQVLRSLYFIGLMSVDPMTRGQVYYQDALDAIELSLSLNPENPRAHYMDAMMTLNMPDFMGGGPIQAKPIFHLAAGKFESFKPQGPFWPIWGEDMNQGTLDLLEE